MKKVLCLLCLFIFGIALTACQTPEMSNDKLVIGMECGYQPYNWTQFDKSNGAVAISGKPGQYANGYDVQMAKKIADALDMKLEIYAYEWDSLVPAVQAGTLDLIIAGMSPTDDRKLLVDFSDPYLTSNLVVVVRKDGAFANATSLADFANAKIVAQAGTFHDTVIDQIAGVQHLQAMDDFPTMISALKAKTIDGYIAEEPGAIADCQGNSEFKYISLVNNQNGFAITDLTNVTIAVGVQKGSELLAKVNQAIAGISEATRLQLLEEAIANAAQLGL